MRLLFSLFISTILIFASCGEKSFFEQNKTIENSVWKWEDVVTIDVPIEDTISGFNFILNLRTTKSYEFSNIYVFVNLKFPDGRSIRDTVECLLADDAGNWLGKTSGSLVDNHVLFSTNRIFPVKGTYQFAIEQGMRVQELNDVTDVGIRIEQVKRK